MPAERPLLLPVLVPVTEKIEHSGAADLGKYKPRVEERL